MAGVETPRQTAARPPQVRLDRANQSKSNAAIVSFCVHADSVILVQACGSVFQSDWLNMLEQKELYG